MTRKVSGEIRKCFRPRYIRSGQQHKLLNALRFDRQQREAIRHARQRREDRTDRGMLQFRHDARRARLSAVIEPVVAVPASLGAGPHLRLSALTQWNGGSGNDLIQWAEDPPVFARFNLVYGLPVPPPVVVPLAVVTLGAYDLIVARRLHRATV